MPHAIYPGSFDPITNGHLDIIERGCKLFEKVTIGILLNPSKNPMFTVEERLDMIREVIKPWPMVEVDTFHGLLVDYARERKANCIVRGLRAVTDFEYELQMAQMNRHMQPDIETVFLMSADVYSFVSSKLVKEIFLLGRPVSKFVPRYVEERMREKLTRR